MTDRLTGLVWTENANLLDFPQTWAEALQAVGQMNQERFLGHADWRLPNRRELRSLISHGSRKPALPGGHPFKSVYLGWYWTSTTAAIAPAYAWYVHLEGGRMFYGKKDGYCLTWPVRGTSPVLAATGQTSCFDVVGKEISCSGTGQDGEFCLGVAWPEPRFKSTGQGIVDRLTGLCWYPEADLCAGMTTWQNALDAAADLRRQTGLPWRLPTINELESLVDASAHTPALPQGHPFTNIRDGYWSSTTSFFEPDWSYCLYLNKGAVGVGWKPGPEFHCWPVLSLPHPVQTSSSTESNA